jgi:hypothetical protein
MNALCKALLFGVAAVVSVNAFAAKQADPPPALAADTKDKFDDQAAAIRQQMKPGGYWEFVSNTERSTVERRLDEISQLLATTHTAGDLQPKEKSQALTAQEEINAILGKKDGRRLICKSVSPTGSHRKQTECQTFAERERSRREAQSTMRDRSRDAQGMVTGN